MDALSMEHGGGIGAGRALKSESQKNGNRDLYFDNLKGVLILLVVIGHFLLPMERTRLVWSIFFITYLFHMPMFIFISGYFAKGVVRDGELQLAKVMRIVWLYVVFKVLAHVTENLAAGTPVLRPVDFSFEGGAPWYLLAMMWWYLSLPVITRFKPKVVMILSVIIGLFSGYQMGLGDWLAMSRTVTFAPFFYAGYYLKQEQVQQFVKSRSRWVFPVLALVLIGVLAVGNEAVFGPYKRVVYGMNYMDMNPAVYAWGGLVRAAQYVGAAVISLGIMAVMPRNKTIFTGIGEKSMQIYILHRLLRDMMQYWGFYECFTSQHRTAVLFVIGLAAAVTYFLGQPCITAVFQKLQRVPDYCLSKWRLDN